MYCPKCKKALLEPYPLSAPNTFKCMKCNVEFIIKVVCYELKEGIEALTRGFEK